MFNGISIIINGDIFVHYRNIAVIGPVDSIDRAAIIAQTLLEKGRLGLLKILRTEKVYQL